MSLYYIRRIHFVSKQISASADGCMDKVMMVEDVEWESEKLCTHVMEQACQENYVTKFKPTDVSYPVILAVRKHIHYSFHY